MNFLWVLFTICARLSTLALAAGNGATTTPSTITPWWNTYIYTPYGAPAMTTFPADDPRFEVDTMNPEGDVDAEFSYLPDKEGLFKHEGSWRRLSSKYRHQCINFVDWGFHHNISAYHTKYIRNVSPDNVTCTIYNTMHCDTPPCAKSDPKNCQVAKVDGNGVTKMIRENDFRNPITQELMNNTAHLFKFWVDMGWVQIDTKMDQGRDPRYEWFGALTAQFPGRFGEGRVASVKCTMNEEEKKKQVAASMQVLIESRKSRLAMKTVSPGVTGTGTRSVEGARCTMDPELCELLYPEDGNPVQMTLDDEFLR